MGGGKQGIENKKPMEHKTGNCGKQGTKNWEQGTRKKEQQRTVNIE
jgi:hypothetical protein